MSEAKADAAPKPKKKLLMFIIIGVVVLVLLVGGGLAAFLLLKSNSEDDAGGHAPKTEAKKDSKKDAKKDEKKKPPVFEKLAVFTVNLNAPETNEVLQTEISVELSSDKEKELLKQYLPKIQSEVNLLLRSKKPDEVKTAEGTIKLGGEIRARINGILKVTAEDEGVLSVQFTTFIVR